MEVLSEVEGNLAIDGEECGQFQVSQIMSHGDSRDKEDLMRFMNRYISWCTAVNIPNRSGGSWQIRCTDEICCQPKCTISQRGGLVLISQGKS